MDENNVLKEYQLWSDERLIYEDTCVRILKEDTMEDKIFDSVSRLYVEPPFMYCHIIDLEVTGETDEYIDGKVVKVRSVSY